MEVKEIKINELTFADYNPRKLTEDEYNDLKASLENFGIVDPIVVNENPERQNIIIGGHQRVRVWKDMGNATIPVVFVNLALEKERELNIRLNKNHGEWDWEVLLEEFEKDDLLEWGFQEVEFEMGSENLEETNGDELVPDPKEAPITVEGDLYELGPHKLLCGDATLIDHAEKLMSGDTGSLVVTDPPYNVSYEGKTKDKLKIDNDEMSNDDFFEFLLSAMTNYGLSTKNGASAYVFHADTEGLNFRKAFIEAGFELKQCCIWVKDTMVMGRQDYHWKHEPILYGWKKGAAHSWNSDRKQTTVWAFDRPKQNKDHPTMKPINLICYPILNSSKKDDIVLDFFGGSGSTLIACEKTNRQCRMMEIDPIYCDVIVRRYINFCKNNDRPVEIKRNDQPCEDFSDDDTP